MIFCKNMLLFVLVILHFLSMLLPLGKGKIYSVFKDFSEVGSHEGIRNENIAYSSLIV